MILKQKQGYQRREFELTGNFLHVKYKAEGQTKEWTVKLENIGDSVYYESNTRRKGYILSSIFAAFLIFITVALFMSDDIMGNLPVVIGAYIIFGSLIPLNLLLPLKKVMYIVGGSESVTFFQNSPSVEEANKFVNEVIARSKNIFIEKYARIDPDLPEETMMNQLNWLKTRDLISRQMYNQLKSDYKTQKLIQN